MLRNKGSHKGLFSPVLNDAEIEAGEVSADEGLEDTYDPASIKLTVGVCHLQM